MGLGVPSSWRGRMVLPTDGGLCSPWRAAHSLPPRRRGPCRNEPVCWEHTLPASLHRSVGAQKKTGRFSSSGSFLRRGRDSNPRILSDQRFSRPPQSTTLPPLLPLWDCKYRNNFLFSKIILKKCKKKAGRPTYNAFLQGVLTHINNQ